jgi:hypothetical protein
MESGQNLMMASHMGMRLGMRRILVGGAGVGAVVTVVEPRGRIGNVWKETNGGERMRRCDGW